MALTNGTGDNGFTMPVVPMGTGFGNGGFGGWGGDGAWWLLILLFALGGGWGNGFGGFGGGDMVLPYMWNTATQNDVNRGFDTSGLSAQLSGIQSSISNGFASTEVAECNRAMNAQATAYNNQIASMNQNFATATELDNRLDTLAMSLQKCCCDNELATEGLKYTIATEACADRAAVSDGVRDIIANQTAGIQTILDKLCQQEIDALKTQNANLQTQVNMQALAASQGAQTAALIQDNNAQTQALIQRIAPYPTPAYVVANPYGYGYNNNYGCGCNGGIA